MARKTLVFVRDIHSLWKQLVLCILAVTWVIQVVVLLFSQLDDWREMVTIVLDGLPEEAIRRQGLAELTQDDTYDFVRFCQDHVSPDQDIVVLDYAADIRRRVVFRYYLYPFSSFHYVTPTLPADALIDDLITDRGVDYVIVNADAAHYPLFAAALQADRLDFDERRFLLVISPPGRDESD